jgi:hypothetical protein
MAENGSCKKDSLIEGWKLRQEDATMLLLLFIGASFELQELDKLELVEFRF